MCHTARDGGHLAKLISLAAADATRAWRLLERRPARGRPQRFAQWQIAVLIVIAIAHRCKSKSSQYRFLQQHQRPLRGLNRRLGLKRLPSRATYMRRYAESYALYQKMIQLGGQRALAAARSDARIVAVDKSNIAARGPARGKRPRIGVDLDAGWSRSVHDGWVWGYSYEAVVCASQNRPILLLLASADRASCSEHRSFGPKIACLPPTVRHVLADAGYDNNDYGEAIEYTAGGEPSGRHYLCPMQRRGGKPAVGRTVHKGRREQRRRHRQARQRFLRSRRGRRLFAQRQACIEPFHHWFKQLFGLHQSVWHRGLRDNQTTLMACLYCYQLLQRHNHRLGHPNNQVQWILDGL